MKRAFIGILACVALFAVLGTPSAMAQFTLDSIMPGMGEFTPGVGMMGSQSALEASPSFPEPGAPFTVRLQAPSSDTAGAEIRWFEDGTELPQFRNQRDVELSAGELGETSTISAVLNLNNGQQEEVTLQVRPVYVDIIIEADTMVPAFYKGRAVPSGDTTARATAIPTIGRPLNESSLSYEWNLGSEPLSGGRIRGLQTVEFSPRKFGEQWLSVSIYEGSTLIAERTMSMTTVEPEILFYERNPLYGIKRRAITQDITLSGNQINVKAEPFYTSPMNNMNDYVVEWNVGGQRIDTTDADEPLLATLRGSGGESESSVMLRIFDQTTNRKIFDSFTLQFGF